MSAEKFEFQAEIRQILDIVIHSLYTQKEIFIRELVSNASDALEKLRHLQLTEREVFDDRLGLEINITTDDQAKTIAIQDYGVGMTREELIENLGTIAHSGSKAFLEAIKQSGERNANLIGQFGVGFYSAFMVAELVTVFTRTWRKDGKGWRWESDGSGTYSIEPADGLRRGTKVVVKLKREFGEFALADRVEQALKRYSAFVPFPIYLNGKQVNTVEALWLKPRDTIKEEEYVEFFKFHAHSNEEPLLKLHFSADAPLQIYALLFVPKTNTEKFGFGRMEPSVSLHCRKILIEEAPRGLLPEWLRFLHGVVDSEDLPLNISREAPQDKALIEKIGRVLTKRFLKFLEETATKNPELYDKFIREFGFFLKEGAATDFSHRESLLPLLRFETSFLEPEKTTSLSDYVSRMKSGQEEIYFLIGANRKSLEESPYLEGLRARGLEVLFCYEPVDEIVFNTTREFEKKRFVSADRADLNLVGVEPPAAEGELEKSAADELAAWLKAEFGEQVATVRPSRRLTDSPILALLDKHEFSPHIRRAMKLWNPDAPQLPLRVNLEFNPAHGAIKKLHALRQQNPGKAKLLAAHLLDAALLAAGLAEDPVQIARRMYQLAAEFDA